MVVLVPHELVCAGRCCGGAGVYVGKRGVLGAQTGQPACMVTFRAKPRSRSRKPRAKESKERLPWRGEVTIATFGFGMF